MDRPGGLGPGYGPTPNLDKQKSTAPSQDMISPVGPDELPNDVQARILAFQRERQFRSAAVAAAASQAGPGDGKSYSPRGSVSSSDFDNSFLPSRQHSTSTPRSPALGNKSPKPQSAFRIDRNPESLNSSRRTSASSTLSNLDLSTPSSKGNDEQRNPSLTDNNVKGLPTSPNLQKTNRLLSVLPEYRAADCKGLPSSPGPGGVALLRPSPAALSRMSSANSVRGNGCMKSPSSVSLSSTVSSTGTSVSSSPEVSPHLPSWRASQNQRSDFLRIPQRRSSSTKNAYGGDQLPSGLNVDVDSPTIPSASTSPTSKDKISSLSSSSSSSPEEVRVPKSTECIKSPEPTTGFTGPSAGKSSPASRPRLPKMSLSARRGLRLNNLVDEQQQQPKNNRPRFLSNPTNEIPKQLSTSTRCASERSSISDASDGPKGIERAMSSLSLSSQESGLSPLEMTTNGQFDDYSKYIDVVSGSLRFAGKASIHPGGVDFLNGTSIRLSLEQLEVIEELGRGNYGTVSKVRHKPTGRILAMKEIRLELDEAKLAAIIMELEILHKCKSPYIVDFFGAFFAEGAVYMCMEYMDGGSLESFPDVDGAVSEMYLVQIAYSVVLGLKQLKDEHDIIHRDVKPSNILASTEGKIKMCDFGVSGKLVASMAKTNIGCQSYMAPERIQSSSANMGTYTIESDVWSLGLSLLEIALGRYPYPPETFGNIFSQLSAIVDGESPKLPPDLYSPEACDFVAKCLIKDSRKRPSYSELLQHPWITRFVENKSSYASLAEFVQQSVAKRSLHKAKG